MKISYRNFCIGLGLPLNNYRNSWCAINHEKRQAIFTIWDDRLTPPERNSTDFTDLMDPSRKQPGAPEFRHVIETVLRDKYTAYGIMSWAKDPDADPRTRKKFCSDKLFTLDIKKDGDSVIAQFVDVVSAESVRRKSSVVELLNGSAIDDIGAADVGNDDPEYRRRMSGSYVRNAEVRQHVLKRAKGKCEHCKSAGFTKDNGKPYLEAHHIISLAKQGPDTIENVIALCANHHREAHFSANWLELETQFKAYLAGLKVPT